MSCKTMRPICDALASIGVVVESCCDGQGGKAVFHVAMRLASFDALEQIARAIPLQFSADKRHSDRALHSLGFVLIIRGIENGYLNVVLESLPMSLEKSTEVLTANIERLANCIRNISIKRGIE